MRLDNTMINKRMLINVGFGQPIIKEIMLLELSENDKIAKLKNKNGLIEYAQVDNITVHRVFDTSERIILKD